MHEDTAQTVVLDDEAPPPEPQNSFYDTTTSLLRTALLLMAFTMEVGAGLALRAAWQSAPNSSEDWDKLRSELVIARQGMGEIVRQVTMLRNEPAIFANRFWRDFYRAMLSNAVRSAMTKLTLLTIGLWLFIAQSAHAADRLNLVIAIDVTRSVPLSGRMARASFRRMSMG